jgi:hypothetical protein
VDIDPSDGEWSYGEWSQYDEKPAASVGIPDIEHRFIVMK